MIGCDLHDGVDDFEDRRRAGGAGNPLRDNTAKGRKALIRPTPGSRQGGGRDANRLRLRGVRTGVSGSTTNWLRPESNVTSCATRITRSVRHAAKNGRAGRPATAGVAAGARFGGRRSACGVDPDRQTRDDREVGADALWTWEKKITALKTQVQSLPKRCQLRRPKTTGKGWTTAFWKWLECALAEPALPKSCPLGRGGQAALSSLLRQLRWLEEEQARLDERCIRWRRRTLCGGDPGDDARVRRGHPHRPCVPRPKWATSAALPIAGRSPPIWGWRRRATSRAKRATERATSRTRAPAACEKCSARRRGLGCVGTRRKKRFTIASRRRTANTRRLPWWPMIDD